MASLACQQASRYASICQIISTGMSRMQHVEDMLPLWLVCKPWSGSDFTRLIMELAIWLMHCTMAARSSSQ